MSAQYGKCNFDGKPVESQELDRVRAVLAPYGPDAEGIFCKDNVGIVYRAFHATKESRLEKQPYVSPSGAIITWDGRLDNRSELIYELGSALSSDSSDLSIVAAAYQRWGTDSFAKLVGDWALSIWDPDQRSLILAKDPIGTRHLYYLAKTHAVTWSTILDPLVLLRGEAFTLCEEYIAGWVSSFPAVHLTPYVGIHSVPPSSFTLLCLGRQNIKKYWDFDPNKEIRHGADFEYEEHFREVFEQAVRRRLRSDCPILAELSGGIDSASIVSMADRVIAQGEAETPRLDTISYYDDSEPHWNERPYFTKVEEKRGQVGCHINVCSQHTLVSRYERDRFAATPNSPRQLTDSARQFAILLASRGNRVVLSGTGGDEVLGGVPTPIPELANLLARVHLGAFGKQIASWALAKKQPLIHLAAETVRAFLPVGLVGVEKGKETDDWLEAAFVKRNHRALQRYETRLRVFGPLPSFQDAMTTLSGLRRQLAASCLSPRIPHEKAYPYLDRDLLEFLYAIPREQLLRPHQRRSLMRRALAGIVPSEILNRKRKAFVVRSVVSAVAAEWSNLVVLTDAMAGSLPGIVHPKAVVKALQRARSGREMPQIGMINMFRIHSWVQQLQDWNVLRSPDADQMFRGGPELNLGPLGSETQIVERR